MVEAGVGGDANERTFELTNVGGDARGDELEGFGGNRAVIALGLVAQDGEPRLEVGRLNVGDQAPLEPAAQPLLQCRYGIGHAVAGDDDLLVGTVQRVERVEELLLQTFLALHELDVVDQQHVDVAVAALEVGDGVGTDAVDVLVEERLGADVANDVVLVVAVHVVPDGMQQVGLAETGRAVDEQRVVRLGPGVSATRNAAASANWLDAPLTNASNVYRGFMPPLLAGIAEPTSAAVVARLDRCVGNLFDELLLGRVGDLHLDDELTIGGADLFEASRTNGR